MIRQCLSRNHSHLLFFLSTFCTGLLLFSATVRAEVTGDVNGDNKVDLVESIYALRVAAGIVPSFDNASIVGSWGNGFYPYGFDFNGEEEYISLTFYPNGYYIHYETGQPSELCDNGGGVEIGTYTYDQSSGQLTVSPIIDDNGCVGLAENGVGSTFSLTVTDDYIKADDSKELYRVSKESNFLILGGWGEGHTTNDASEDEYLSATFYPNGYYIHYQSHTSDETCDEGGGVEIGTYTFDQSSGDLVATPIIDENGCVGLSDTGVPGTLNITVTADLLQVNDEIDPEPPLPRVQD